MFEGNSALGFVAVLAVILFSTKLLGLIFRKIGLPQVLGYIIAGILIGPAIFGDFCGFTLIGFEGHDYRAHGGVLFLVVRARLRGNTRCSDSPRSAEVSTGHFRSLRNCASSITPNPRAALTNRKNAWFYRLMRQSFS